MALVPSVEADVAKIVTFLYKASQIHGLPLCTSVAGGGGSLIGRASVAGGVHISLRDLKGVTFEGDVAKVGGGATWGDVQTSAIWHDKFLTTAECPALGVGGFTHNGGGTVVTQLCTCAVDIVDADASVEKP